MVTGTSEVIGYEDAGLFLFLFVLKNAKEALERWLDG